MNMNGREWTRIEPQRQFLVFHSRSIHLSSYVSTMRLFSSLAGSYLPSADLAMLPRAEFHPLAGSRLRLETEAVSTSPRCP